jgi:hypothetical protein
VLIKYIDKKAFKTSVMKKSVKLLLCTVFTTVIFAGSANATSLTTYHSLPPSFSDTSKAYDVPSLPYKGLPPQYSSLTAMPEKSSFTEGAPPAYHELLPEAPPAYDEPSISLTEQPPTYASLFPKNDDASFDNDEPMSIIELTETPRYQMKEVLDLCDMAYKTGGDWSDLVNQQKGKGFEIKSFAASYEERSGFVRIHPDGQCDVVFKGTKNIANVLTDLWANWAINSESHLRVHNGMMAHALTVLPDIAGILMTEAAHRGIPSKELNIKIMGHSLGAGTAQVIAPFLDGPFHIRSVDAVAAPQVFDADSADAYNEKLGSRTTCYNQDLDPVTYVGALNPFRLLLSPFLFFLPETAPVGHQITLPTKGAVHKMSGYKASVEKLDQDDGGYTFASRMDSKPKKYMKKILGIPARIENRIHHGFARVKRFLIG